MSNNTIEGKLKGLQERFEMELRIQKEGGSHNQGGFGTQSTRLGNTKRPKPPPIFNDKEIPAYPPMPTHHKETENKMREVYKMSGKLNIDGVEYASKTTDLKDLGELGSGTCGHVVKMRHKPSSVIIAVKQMRRSGNSEETKRILMDLDIVVRSYDCPYIVRCFGCFVTDVDVWICMELMASCFDKLLKRLGAPIPEEILGKVTVATVNALSYLKDKHGVIHRDVKPSNILLDERGNVKLCDFGISGRLVDSKAQTKGAGCAAYMAPERIDPPDPTRPDYDIRADVWSLGISLVELATGVFPYRGCQNDFEVLSKVIENDPPSLPEDCNFTTEFKDFVSQCLTKNYKQRPKYPKLLEHPFVVKSARRKVSVGEWYASISTTLGQETATVPDSPTPVAPVTSVPPVTPVPPAMSAAKVTTMTTVATHTVGASSNGLDTPPTPQPVRNFVTSSQFWLPEQTTPTPKRSRWGSSVANAGGSSSQPASLEANFADHSPYPRRRTLEAQAPPTPARRVSADNWLRTSSTSSGNTSPIVIQRFYHQSQQRRSRVDQPSTPRHRSLSREHSAGRSPEPPPRARPLARPHEANGSMELEPPALHERLHPSSPLLLNDRLSEGRSQSLTRAELRNGYRAEPPPPPPLARHHDDQGWLHSLAGLVKRRLGGYVKWHHVAGRRDHHRNTHGQPHLYNRWGNSESWSVPVSPLPPRAPPPRPAD